MSYKVGDYVIVRSLETICAVVVRSFVQGTVSTSIRKKLLTAAAL